MGDWFVGEIRLLPYNNKVPNGWHLCDGSLLNIQQNAALYSLLGIVYGGDGKTTFGLPDLRGRTIVGYGRNASGVVFNAGVKAGTETVTLTATQIPQHNHQVSVSTDPGNAAALGNYFSSVGPNATSTAPTPNLYAPYSSGAQMVQMAPVVVGNSGASAAHENRQPTMALQYCIATTGLYPSRP